MPSSTPTGSPEASPVQTLNRRILSLALPSLGALVAEPILVLVDTAMVGHLGTPQLAGLSLAASVLMTMVGVCVFLAYATTALTSRRAGAGDLRGAHQAGIDGFWLAGILGVILTLVLLILGEPILLALGATPTVLPHALDYLRASSWGLPGMLVVLAATGALRGALDTRTPLRVAVAGALVNIPLNYLLIYVAGWGVAGSGAGTAAVQTGMGVALGWAVIAAARGVEVSLRPQFGGIWRAVLGGLPLLIRTITLRAALLITTAVAATLGAASLGAHQAVMSLWSLASFALDALAIAAQALVGRGLGGGDAESVRHLLARLRLWGIGAGLLIGVVLAALAFVLGPLFSSDPAVHEALRAGLWVAALCLPLAGIVFVGDGVLIGAGDGRYLAVAGVLTLVAYVPAAWAVSNLAPQGPAGLAWLWVAFGLVFMGARAITLETRMAGARWMRIGK